LRRGAEINTAVLTESDVLHIRANELSGLELASKFGVTAAAVSAIRTRKNWAWLKG
jgi:transcriptional regulator